MKPALLILDPQNDFFGDDNPNLAEFQRVVMEINTAIKLFRERNWPILFIQHASNKKALGSPEWAVYGGFDYRPDDIQITKTHKDAFSGTRLDLMLSARSTDLVVVCGFLAEHCVSATYREALERAYGSAVLAEAIAGLDNEATEAVIEACSQITLDELRAIQEHELFRRWDEIGVDSTNHA